MIKNKQIKKAMEILNKELEMNMDLSGKSDSFRHLCTAINELRLTEIFLEKGL